MGAPETRALCSLSTGIVPVGSEGRDELEHESALSSTTPCRCLSFNRQDHFNKPGMKPGAPGSRRNNKEAHKKTLLETGFLGAVLSGSLDTADGCTAAGDGVHSSFLLKQLKLNMSIFYNMGFEPFRHTTISHPSLYFV